MVAKVTGQPLPYGIVIVEGADRSLFASDSGRFAFRDLAPRRYQLRVRRLGYTPITVDVDVRAGVTDTVRVELERVAITLGSITVKAYPPCTAPGAPPLTDTALSTIVAQLRLNAEQMRFLAEQYPYEYVVEIQRSGKLIGKGDIVADPRRTARYTNKSNKPYKPGDVLLRRGGTYYFQIPELVDVANPLFIAAHCWHFAGLDTVDDVEHYRVDVVAADTLRGVDVNGSFLISGTSFQIRRSILHFSRRPPQAKALLDMETTTEFFEVLPSVPIISHVRSVQTMDPRRKTVYAETYEEHRTLTFKFLERKPGEPHLPESKP